MSSNDMQDFASCPICYDLMLDARLTSCGHTFCLRCLTEVFDADEQQILCSTCRSVSHKRPHELQKNFLACQMAEKISEKSSETPNQRENETVLQMVSLPNEFELQADDSDILRFHSRCGSHAQIRENGQLAVRDPSKYCQAIVLSSRQLRDNEVFEVRLESVLLNKCGSVRIGVVNQDPSTIHLPDDASEMGDGSATMMIDSVYKNGCQVYENLSVNLNELRTGDRLGVRLSQNGHLRFFVNGRDLDVTVTGLTGSHWAAVDLYGNAAKVSMVQFCDELEPSTSAADESLEFHDRCGGRLCISEDRRGVSRDPDALENCVAFSSRPLRHDETFEIRVDEMSNQWHGSVQFGVCRYNPDSVDMPADIADMSDSVIVLSGRRVISKGETIDCQVNMNDLRVGDRVGVCVSANGILRFFINGRDISVVVQDVRDPQWAVVDLNGRVTQVSIVSFSVSNQAGLLSLENLELEANQSSQVRQVPSHEEAEALLSSPLRFHSKCGTGVQLAGDRCVAQRDAKVHNNGILLSSRSLRDGEVFQVKEHFTAPTVLNNIIEYPSFSLHSQVKLDALAAKWIGSVAIGVVCLDPDCQQLPSDSTCFDATAVLLSDKSVHNRMTGMTMQDYAEVSLDDLKVGSRLGVSVTADGHLHFFINGRDQGVAASHLPQPLWAVVDLYGRATKVSVCYDSAETA